MPKPKLRIVVASTRPGRVGRPVGDWFKRVANEHHPRLQQYTQEHTRAWSAQVAAADAFVFVTATALSSLRRGS